MRGHGRHHVERHAEQIAMVAEKAAADAGVVFEIISTHGFAEKLTPRLARSVIEALTSNAALFTARQVQFFKSEKFELLDLAAKVEDAAQKEDEDEEDGAPVQTGVERRIDPADGQMYTLAEFVAEYG